MRPPVERKQAELAKGLTGLLADTYMTYNTTQACHWNVEGPQFRSLHQMFEEQYREMANAIDMIAERIRGLGFYAPETVSDLSRVSRIKQRAGMRDPETMLTHLIEAHRQIVHRAGELRGEAERAMDEVTADMLIERMRLHEKTLWMLRSQAGREFMELETADERELAHST